MTKSTRGVADIRHLIITLRLYYTLLYCVVLYLI